MMLFSILILLTFPGTVKASTFYNFLATSQNPDYSDFSLTYNDVDGDAKFSIDELVEGSFSGIQMNIYWHTVLGSVPVNSPESPLTDGDKSRWGFLNPPIVASMAYPEEWTYRQSPVPIPASAYLLGTGLIPLMWAHRKKLLGR
jgi:hypothetical protein